MKKMALAGMLAFGAVGAQAATILGVEVGGTLWHTDNEVKSSSLDAKSAVAGSVYAVLEHPLPLVPNVRVEYLNNKNDIRGGGSSETTHADLTLYYELLDNWVNLDLGVTARQMDARLELGGNAHKADKVLGAGYVRAQFDLPFTGLSVGAAAQHGSSFNGSQRMQDYDAYVQYEVGLGFGVAGGYRLQKYRLDYAGAQQYKHEIDGAYARLFWRF